MAEPVPQGPIAEPARWEDLAARAAPWVALGPAALDDLGRYAVLLSEWNRRLNLTAIEAPDEVLTKHFLDSLSPAAALDLTACRTLCDVGTGAGFPGLVLKIAFPHLEVVLMDALDKRLRFLQRVIADLGLEGVRTVHARCEDAAAHPARGRGGPQPPGGPYREAFDLVTARAVADLRVLAEWTLPLARVGGQVLALKGPACEAEVEAARPALALLGGGEPVLTPLTLPGSDVRRALVLIPKARPTPPDYPRPAGAARRAPL